MSSAPTIDSVHHPATGTWQYIVADPKTHNAVIIDTVLDFDAATQTISTGNADSLVSSIKEKGYNIVRILETHAHADHLTASAYLQQVLGGVQGSKPPICIGKRITQVQKTFGEKYGVPASELENAFDHLFEDDEVFQIGELEAKVVHLPGHTPDHVGYMIGGKFHTQQNLQSIENPLTNTTPQTDNIFCGDSVFNADLGVARCDFPGGSAKALYQSTRKLLSLPDHVRVWTGHDYPSATRKEAVPFMRVDEQRERNGYLQADLTEDGFLEKRTQRDAGLNEPKLLHQSLQVNIRGGRLPKPSAQGMRFLVLPLRVGDAKW
jgi:glyoxylase-like metal-dependent hydrolase (beta-lactamase superfamily II)